MPLLVTLPAESPLLTTAHVPLQRVYALIDNVAYTRRGLAPKRINAKVGYYASEAASLEAESIQLPELPADFFQDATPEQTNAVPIFDYLEGLLYVRLQAVLPFGTLIEFVA